MKKQLEYAIICLAIMMCMSILTVCILHNDDVGLAALAFIITTLSYGIVYGFIKLPGFVAYKLIEHSIRLEE